MATSPNNIGQVTDTLVMAIRENFHDAEVERQPEQIRGYDAYVTIKLPSDWGPVRVSEVEEWARKRAYDILMTLDVDIRVEAYNLTRNQQELVKWIFLHYPDVQEELLPKTSVQYNRDAARELFDEHSERIDERLIQASTPASKDRKYIESKYGLRYGT